MKKPILRSVGQNLDSYNFRCYLDSLTIKDHSDIVTKITEKCFVSRLTVYLWKSGRTKSIKPVYKNIIEEIAGHKIFS